LTQSYHVFVSKESSERVLAGLHRPTHPQTQPTGAVGCIRKHARGRVSVAPERWWRPLTEFRATPFLIECRHCDGAAHPPKAPFRNAILMARRRRSQGQTFVIVTHDPQVAAQTERPVFLQDGRIMIKRSGPGEAKTGLIFL